MAKRIKLAEGDLFALPLRSNGYVVGLITRLSRNKTPLGCFFEKRYETVPSINLIDTSKILLIKRFGNQGFSNGSWYQLGKLPNFQREEWKVPIFVRHTNPYPPSLVYYNNDLEEIKTEVMPHSFDISSYPSDGLGGSGFIEIVLTKILDNKK
jgi:hypothetical protein